MSFWKMAFDMGAIGVELLRQAVKCIENPFGEITPEEFKTICNKDFITQ
ncbi:XkdX family protein [Clostridium sporogenes]|nr:XkdX family protein [Clostridium sporogenes]MCW6062802.1 XkdX family protein [Clostridium sporogenes]MCW6070187.1 XkdX family protein [Clostridium sporogenes]NFQ01078.1 XkdX family protein [Clostridium sporogenes]NFQ42961.1 XkdX family protein [Clostridium sporogenes]